MPSFTPEEYLEYLESREPYKRAPFEPTPHLFVPLTKQITFVAGRATRLTIRRKKVQWFKGALTFTVSMRSLTNRMRFHLIHFDALERPRILARAK